MRALVRAFAGCMALGLAACGSVPSGEDPAQARLSQAALLAASCSGCHADGGAKGGIASLQGLSASALQEKLLAYRNDRDGGTAMHRMAWGYTDAQIVMIADYLGEEPGEKPGE